MNLLIERGTHDVTIETTFIPLVYTHRQTPERRTG